MVPETSAIQSNDEGDRAEHRVTVGKGSAYDFYLSRELKHAAIVRAPHLHRWWMFLLRKGWKSRPVSGSN